PGGAYDFALRGRGLDLSRLGLPPDWGLGGRADAALAVSGRAGDPRWTFDAAARAPAFQGHAGDSLALSLGGAAHRLDVRALDFRLGPGTLHAAGSVEGAPRAWPDSLTATAVVRWLQDAAAWQGGVEAKRLPLDGLGAFAPAADGWGGTLDGTLRVAGSPGAPRLDLEAAADRFGWRDYRAERVETSARYRDGRLEVPETRVRMANVVSTARGEMPLRLALGRPVVVPDEPMSWRIEVPSGDLQLLPLLVPQIQSARGGFDLTASLAGSARHPHLQGSGHIRDGTVRPINREEVLDHVRADLRFDEDRITLDTLTARQGRTGRVWGHGVVQLAGFGLRNYRFDLSLRDFAASEEGLYAMLFDGDFTVVDGPRVNGERLPQVQGNVRLAKGVIEFDFANQSEVQKREATTQPLYWTYHVHVDATNNLRWRPPDGDIEFNAALDLEQTPDSLLIFGEMHALRGTYYFLSNRFTIQNADLTFDNQKGVDPLLDITADTHVRPVQAAASASTLPASEDITVHITGRSSQPVIALSSSDPSSDQERILRELTYLPFTPGAGGSFTDPLDNYLTRQLNAQLSRSLSDFFQGAITEWEVQRDQGGGIATGLAGEGALLVGVGTQITPRIAFRYRQRVGADTRSTVGVDYLLERDVEAEYRLSRFIYLTTELAQHRPGQLAPANGSPNDFNVNLKARWEY
ncbi:MAG TPA: translocation/assembly module TamB domain-containing protein, partial [Candidatus Eisenbacteria bacterium]|nr:translocation/assembly module TamB domain-containing protein [Candidatus Eisenbacteria bacterium]